MDASSIFCSHSDDWGYIALSSNDCVNNSSLAFFILALLALFGVDVRSTTAAVEPRDAITTLERYIRATYARDYEEAYSYIAAADQRLKDRPSYVRDRGAFIGFTLQIARILANYIEVSALETRLVEAGRAKIKIRFKVPDAGKLGPMLHDWDADRLDALSSSERKAIIAAIEKLRQSRDFEMIEGEDVFDLVREGESWKVLLNWASAVKVGFQTSIPNTVPVEAHLQRSSIATRPGEIFKVVLNIKNTSNEQLLVRIGHLVDPHGFRDYLDLVECGFLLPVRLSPGKEEEFVSTYLLRGSFPEGVPQLNVTYAVTPAQ
jgi:Cytochrome c oxidase assembly protein CtaG/Cox11